MTIAQFKLEAIKKLSSSPSPHLDLDVLIEHYTALTKTQALLARNEELAPQVLENLENAVELRATGLPIAYITGHKEFYGYDFLVSPAVLIPKPDTEILVEKAIDIIIEKMENRNGGIGKEGPLLTVCDMCTGSGCIGISVAKQLIEVYKIPASRMPKFTFVDISKSALEIARKNAERLLGCGGVKTGDEFVTRGGGGLKTGDEFVTRGGGLQTNAKSLNLQFLLSNLFDAVPYKFDVILSNPPYIPHSMVEQLLKDGRSEPLLALDGDIDVRTGNGTLQDDGLGIIRELIPQAYEKLATLGSLIMETGEYNAQQAEALAKSNNFSAELYKDLEGQLRGFTANKRV